MDIYKQQEIVHRDAVSVELVAYDDNEVYSVVGVARRHPTDKFSKEIGLKLAYSRALALLANKLDKQATGLMKHKEDMQAAKIKAKMNKEAEDFLTRQKWTSIFDTSPVAKANRNLNVPYSYPKPRYF